LNAAAGPQEAPSPGVPPGLLGRRAALHLLDDVLVRRRALGESEDSEGAGGLVAHRDRAFARLLAATVLRRLGQLDDLLARTLERPLPARAMPVTQVLRLGAAQLLFLSTPPHAAVSTALALVEEAGHPRLKGLVNAVLRRLTREGSAILAGQDAARLNTPGWLWSAWARQWGEETARAIAEAHLAEPPLDITLLREEGGWPEHLAARRLPTGSLRRPVGGRVEDLPGYGEGAWQVQDAAAAIPARLFGPLAGLAVADLCAAPGGKTAQLAAAGATVTAVDRSQARLTLLRRNLRRLGLEAETVLADAAAWEPGRTFDAVLLDAPCSATGTIRRHPDVQHLKEPADVARLARLQGRLLDRAVRLVRPGGLLIWCTCSLQAEEGEEQVARLIASGAPVAREPIRSEEIGGVGGILTNEGDIRTQPGSMAEAGGLDGFHISRLRRLGQVATRP
jgi:16S rRNA (cytosine967-C5)-methyltransferase